LNRVFYPRPIWEFGKGVTEDPIGAAGYPLSACTGVFQVAQTWKQRAMRFEPLE